MQIQMRKCTRCGRISGLGSVVCQGCLSRSFDLIGLPPNGRLVTWTTIRRAPAGFHAAAPYDVAVVELQPGVRVTGRLDSDSPSARMDAPVRVVGIDGDSPVFAVLGKV